jgi:hypothetical protein
MQSQLIIILITTAKEPPLTRQFSFAVAVAKTVCCSTLIRQDYTAMPIKGRLTNLKFIFQDGSEALVKMNNRLFHELAMLEGGEVTHYMNLNTCSWAEWSTGNAPENLVKILYRNCIDYHFLSEKEDCVAPCKVIVSHVD